MSDENKPDALDDGDDLLSDFNDLFPEESDEETNELLVDEHSDDLDSLLEDLDLPDSGSDASSEDEDGIDSLLDSLDETSMDVEAPDEPEAATDSDTMATEDAVDDDDDLDLDSLLDGLEEHVDDMLETDTADEADGGDELDNLLDDMIAETAPADTRELDIEHDELDLAAVSDMDIIEDEPVAEPTSEPEERGEQVEKKEIDSLDDLISDDEDLFTEEEPEVIATTAAALATAAATTAIIDKEESAPAQEAASPRARKEQPQGAKSSSGAGGIIVYSLLIIALAVAGGAIWMVLQAQQSSDINKAQLSKLQKQIERSSALSGSSYNPLSEQNSSAIRDLDQRINELSTMMDGPLSHINSNNEEMMGKYEGRIQQLEQQLADLKSETDAKLAELKSELEKKPAKVTTTTPQLVKPAESSSKAEKLWALNMLSLSSRQAANDEVKRLQDAGINASRDRFTAKDGRTWYRVRVTGFASYEAAKAYAAQLPKIQGISQTWVTPE